MDVFDIKIPYWIGKRLGITFYKMSNGVIRIGLWKLNRFSGSYKDKWGINWWTFIDIGREK